MGKRSKTVRNRLQDDELLKLYEEKASDSTPARTNKRLWNAKFRSCGTV